ncbi:MAG: 1-acyl-sn-glycerol-3-phosphate acyltransferase [Desulfobacterium sp.]|nr:1-acyl-sn-glycerol-3-phosphate acyltransferase [Desulfobacterium sp.]
MRKTFPHWFRILVMNLTVIPATVLMTMVCILVFPLVFLLFRLATPWNNALIMRKFVWYYGRIWQWIISPFVHLELTGFDGKIPVPCVFVVNHLSFFDTFFMNQLPIFNVCFAVRSWPFKMPFYGPFMKLANYLDVESRPWESILASGKAVLEQNGTILFFPEGHRSRDGNLKKFYSGAFKMSVEAGVPLVPLCITGTDCFFPPARGWFAPCRIKIRMLDPVHPETFNSHLPHCEMKKKVHALMAQNIKSMNHQDNNR